MPDDSDKAHQENAQDASLAQAGEPHGTTEGTTPAASQATDTPTSEDLDVREARLGGPRKAMGPGEDVDETVPEEQEHEQ